MMYWRAFQCEFGGWCFLFFFLKKGSRKGCPYIIRLFYVWGVSIKRAEAHAEGVRARAMVADAPP